MTHNIKIFLLLFCAAFVAVSCKKNDYLTDGGLHSAQTPLNTYDYLKSNQYKLFDTFLLVIDRFKLQDELMSSKTVFAVTDYSIRRYMDIRQSILRLSDESKVYSLDSLYKDMTADSVRQYFFNERYTLADAVMEPEVKEATSRGNTKCGISKRMFTIAELNADGGLRSWTQTPAFGLYYTNVRGTLDVPGVTPPPNEADVKVLCQTSGILPSSTSKDPAYDQVLHVLSNQHTFARF
ncbi:hypothetical protein EXU57_11000 [Segetibacter sp. 3557_3]|uniref:hypothetical protein n=1 Tax=Segetibacter sp. 3557_3 TaxID=2547429 RepID=UPI001058926B|nr:hypothetical protein [Segetibacter sp. 3557_3]TDH26608.1 hypothetical protein EXU57_11000 [Segetibacter sp. 3557_3]